MQHKLQRKQNNRRKNQVEATTYSSYQNSIQKQIIPYFEKRYPKLLLQDLTARHIQEYYSYELEERKCSTNTVIHRHANIRKALQYAFKTDLINTVIHRHANIRKALQYAFKTDLIDCNPADKIQRPKKNRHEVVPYNAQELAQLFEAVKGNLLELGVLLAAFYGLRREEVLGLKWDAIDFKKKTITIRHTVTEANIDGKHTIIEKDRTKTKSSHRTLPLVESFEKFLRELKKKQAENQRLCGSCYCQDYLDYIYLNELGERVKPNWLTTAFPAFLEKHGLRRIRFHDLRHSCASLLYANGVALKDIQEWLGHSDIGTTSNIYTHLDYSSKVASAQAIEGILPQ